MTWLYPTELQDIYPAFPVTGGICQHPRRRNGWARHCAVDAQLERASRFVISHAGNKDVVTINAKNAATCRQRFRPKLTRTRFIQVSLNTNQAPAADRYAIL